MNISIVGIKQAKNIEGTVVVVDVLRAFTTAAAAFHAGVQTIVPVSKIEAMWEWRKQGYLLAGEKRGKKVKGFDFGNSPTEMLNANLHAQKLALRTSLGTQGIIRAKNARHVFAASLVVADATVQALKGAKHVTFLLTGSDDDDLAAAEYMKARLQGVHLTDIGERVRSVGIKNFSSYPSLGSTYLADVEEACKINRFSFAMKLHNGALQIEIPLSKGD